MIYKEKLCQTEPKTKLNNKGCHRTTGCGVEKTKSKHTASEEGLAIAYTTLPFTRKEVAHCTRKFKVMDHA